LWENNPPALAKLRIIYLCTAIQIPYSDHKSPDRRKNANIVAAVILRFRFVRVSTVAALQEQDKTNKLGDTVKLSEQN